MQHLAPLVRSAAPASGEPDPGIPDDLLRADDALRHRRLRDAERRAICAVDRPPTARSVSAIWLGEDRSGWQQPKSKASESSLSAGSASAGGPSSSDCGVAIAISSSRVRRDCSLRNLVRQPTRGDRDQPAARVVRQAAGRPLQRGGQQGLLAGVLAQVELPVPAHQRGEDLRCQFAQQVLDVALARAHRSGLASCMIGQNSTGSTSAQGMSAAICSARSWLSQSSR